MDNIETLRKEKDTILAEWQIYHRNPRGTKMPNMERLAILRATIRKIERDNV